MLHSIRSRLLHLVFGEGFQGDLADRGITWLARESRQAIDREPERITSVSLRPGETYTVIARPRPTRTERKTAARAKSLAELDEKMSRPTRKQLRAARRLRKAQRRLDRRRAGTARHRRASAAESAAGRRFDRVTAPSKRLARVRRERAAAESELTALRKSNFDAARGKRGHPRGRSTVFD
jgi:hypothetical protein